MATNRFPRRPQVDLRLRESQSATDNLGMTELVHRDTPAGDLLTLEDATARSGFTARVLALAVAMGSLPVVTTDGGRRVRRGDLEAWMGTLQLAQELGDPSWAPLTGAGAYGSQRGRHRRASDAFRADREAPACPQCEAPMRVSTREYTCASGHRMPPSEAASLQERRMRIALMHSAREARDNHATALLLAEQAAAGNRRQALSERAQFLSDLADALEHILAAIPGGLPIHRPAAKPFRP